MVGAPYANPNGDESAGSVYVYSGRTNGLLLQLDGNRTFDLFGTSLAAAGDVNGDGTEDLIVGAPRVDDPFSGFSAVGSAYVFSGVNGGLLHRIQGTQANESLGYSVSGAGDVNLDGFDDFLIGAPGYNSFNGIARLYSGADGAVLDQFDVTDPLGQFGQVVANAGDVNDDGVPDQIVSSATMDPNGIEDSGLAVVYSGATGGQIYAFSGISNQDWLGSSVAGVGDINADGFDDLLIGIPGADSDGLSGAGIAILYSGATGAQMREFKGRTLGARLGGAVSTAGDLNGDGNIDLLIGSFLAKANGLSNAGAAFVFSTNGDLIHQFNGSQSGGWFGNAVSALGDVNGDGFDEILVGAQHQDSTSNTQAGATYLLGLNPFLAASSSTVSASGGALLGLEFDFPIDAANDEYKILMSGSAPGSFQFGVEIPLALDTTVIESFYNNYPFAYSTGLQGNLNANGDGSASIGILPGTIMVHIGRTFRLAVIANQPGLLPRYSSIAIPVEITS
jgi:hypothetical protein